jgi:predicted nucleic acid-binding protein
VPIVLDASPLIYLATLDALDVFSTSDPGQVPSRVMYEAARPELAYSHPEVVRIDEAVRAGWLVEVSLGEQERALVSALAARLSGLHEGELEVLAKRALVSALAARLSGLHEGELEVLAIGQSRGWQVCVHERQASRLATALGLRSVHVVELLFAATGDRARLVERIRTFGAMTNLATGDLDAVLDLAHRRES